MSFDAAGYTPVNQLDAKGQHATSIASGAPLSFTSFETFESGPCTENPPLVDPSQPLWIEALTVNYKVDDSHSSANSDGVDFTELLVQHDISPIVRGSYSAIPTFLLRLINSMTSD